jgi:hypothetical protein
MSEETWWDRLHDPNAQTLQLKKPKRNRLPWTIIILTVVGLTAFGLDMAQPLPDPMHSSVGN